MGDAASTEQYIAFTGQYHSGLGCYELMQPDHIRAFRIHGAASNGTE